MKDIRETGQAPDPELLKLYEETVMKQLASIKGLPVHETLFHVPTLKVFVQNELDRWYIIYKEALAASVFADTKLQFSEWDEDVTFGDNDWRKTGDDWVAKIACDYTSVIRKISELPGSESMKKRLVTFILRHPRLLYPLAIALWITSPLWIHDSILRRRRS